MPILSMQEDTLTVPRAAARAGFRNDVRAPMTDFLICLSAANLCFVNWWYGLQAINIPWESYYRDAPPAGTLPWAILSDGLLLALAFWFFWEWARKPGKPMVATGGGIAFLLTLVFPLELVRGVWNAEGTVPGILARGALLLTEVSLAAGAVQMFFRQNQPLAGSARTAPSASLRIARTTERSAPCALLRAAKKAVLAMNLLFAAMLVSYFFSWAGSPGAAAYASLPAAAPVPARSGATPRVVWLVFDEMDQRLTFPERPASVHLPELDRLRAESLYADHAQPSATWTSMALPSLLTGAIVSKVEAKGPRELRLSFAGGRMAGSWSRQPNVFDNARKLGVNSALAGWYHPYCRVLGRSLAGCFGEPGFNSVDVYATRIGMVRTMWFLLRAQAEALLSEVHPICTKPTDIELRAFGRLHQQERYFANRKYALDLAANPAYGLVFVHWPVPHPVGIYNRRLHNFNAGGGEQTYLDNLELVAVTLGELRRAMQAAGIWDRTTLIITADHGFRPNVWAERLKWMREVLVEARDTAARPVPFVVKFAGQETGAVYSQPFNNVLTHDLVLAVLSGEIQTAVAARTWLDRNRARFPARTGG
ncbi:MAG: alkaline phosphatase family protein [Bryobacteraceae bacterium]